MSVRFHFFAMTILGLACFVTQAAPAYAQFLTGYQPDDSAYLPATPQEALSPVQQDDSVVVYSLDDGKPINIDNAPPNVLDAHARTESYDSSYDSPPYIGTTSSVDADQETGSIAGYAREDVDPYVREITPSAQKDREEAKTLPVDFTADNLIHDDENGVIVARGDVVLVQGDRTLKADEVHYDINTDRVMAKGDVLLVDDNGDTHMADEAQLDNAMKEGFVLGIESYLVDGGRLTAVRAERHENSVVMTDASYTPCDCDVDENGRPGWQIRADSLEYDEQAHRVSYKNAKFEILGVPVFWTPYLSHPDGQIKRKSGFLSPEVGYASDLGLNVKQDYYWNIAPDRDATIGLLMTTQEAPVVIGQYRQRFENASLVVDGSSTYSGRTDNVSGESVAKDDEIRGHLFTKARWDINSKWRAGADLELTSDDQYLRQYDFSDDDVLENEIFVERFSGRNYAVGRALAFQDVRIIENQVDQPNVLPEVIASFIGEPNATLGGRWKVGVSALGVQRKGSGQDMSRFVLETNWQRRLESEYGLLTTVDLSLRGDAYYTSDVDLTYFSGYSGTVNDNGADTRGFAQAHIVSSYPLVKDLDNSQVVVEPMAALTLAPNINRQSGYFPNEDSQDVQIDASNVFNNDRFPGKDRIEDESRVTYGMKTGLYSHEGSYINAFAGQSYTLNDDDNPFPVGSGLSNQASDVVGQLSAMYRNSYGFNYRFQLDSENLGSQRHEFDGHAHWDRFSLNTRYLYANALDGTDIDSSREQVDTSAGYYLTPKWRLRGRGLYDLGDAPGLRKAGLGLDYFGCCVSFSINANRTLTTDSSGDSGTDITFRVGLKNIGEFDTSSVEESSATNSVDNGAN